MTPEESLREALKYFVNHPDVSFSDLDRTARVEICTLLAGEPTLEKAANEVETATARACEAIEAFGKAVREFQASMLEAERLKNARTD